MRSIKWIVLFCIFVSFSKNTWSATSLQYVHPETAITWGDSGTTENLDLNGLTTANGRLGSYNDRGSGVHAVDYIWRCSIQVNATVTIDVPVVEVWLATADVTTAFDSEIAITDTADAALTASLRNNLKFLGTVVADQTAATVDMTASGFFQDRSRYLALGVYNVSGVTLKATANSSQCSITPVPLEMQ